MKIKIKKILNNLKKGCPYILLTIANIIFCISYYILKVLKGVNFYEMIYYFTSDKTGTGPDIILDGIKTCILLFIIIEIILILPIIKYKKTTLKNNYLKIFTKHKIIYSTGLFILSIIVVLNVMDINTFLKSNNQTTNIYEKYYKKTKDVNISFPKDQKYNLVLIYLESMESSLTSKENGGAFNDSRIPELETLALNNINFSNTKNIGGGYNLTLTSWTLASTIATTSGTALSGQTKKEYKEKRFMPNIITLGDILKEQGYNLEIIQGSNIKFAGVDRYFRMHGNYQIFDINTAKEKNYIDEDYNVWWGFEDKKLFEYAKTEITNLSNKNNPFAITLFTMDTHFKDGYLDPSCDTKFDDQLSNVYACSSKMTFEFINWLEKQPFYDNTVIVLLGDHLTMQNEYFNDYEHYNRTIYNTFINSRANTNNNKNREFTSLDMFPTILASLGANIEGNQLGFGVNLFSDEKTIIEKIGRNRFNNELLKKSKYYKKEILKLELDTK